MDVENPSGKDQENLAPNPLVAAKLAARRIAAEEANKKNSEGMSWLLQNILLHNTVDKGWWLPEAARDLSNVNWSPVSAMVYQHRTHEIPDIGEHLVREDKLNQNPLHWCALWGYEQECLYFLEKGANPNAKDYNCRTPLEIAQEASKRTTGAPKKIVEILAKATVARQKKILRGPEIDL